MKRLLLLIVLAPVLLASASVDAHGVVVGGYDVAQLASETIDILGEKRLFDAAEAKALEGAVAALPSGDPLLAAGPLVGLYGKLFTGLVARGVVTAQEVAAAKASATASGGVKAAGMNPLVLAASCLDLLARKGLLAAEDAQQLLDGAKVSAKKPIRLTTKRTKG